MISDLDQEIVQEQMTLDEKAAAQEVERDYAVQRAATQRMFERYLEHCAGLKQQQNINAL